MGENWLEAMSEIWSHIFQVKWIVWDPYFYIVKFYKYIVGEIKTYIKRDKNCASLGLLFCGTKLQMTMPVEFLDEKCNLRIWCAVL